MEKKSNPNFKMDVQDRKDHLKNIKAAIYERLLVKPTNELEDVQFTDWFVQRLVMAKTEQEKWALLQERYSKEDIALMKLVQLLNQRLEAMDKVIESPEEVVKVFYSMVDDWENFCFFHDWYTPVKDSNGISSSLMVLLWEMGVVSLVKFEDDMFPLRNHMLRPIST